MSSLLQVARDQDYLIVAYAGELPAVHERVYQCWKPKAQRLEPDGYAYLELSEWGAAIPITYDDSRISLNDVVGLFNLTGWYEGVGWGCPRPKKPYRYGGGHGRFVVVCQE